MKEVLWTVEFDRKTYSRQKVRMMGRKLHKEVPNFFGFSDASSITFRFENEEQANKLKPKLTEVIKTWDEKGL